MFDQKDLEQIHSKGIDEKEALRQLELFRKGVNPINLARAASIDDGILKPSNEAAYLKIFEQYQGKAMKFVPASGAASRMFKNLFEFLETQKDIEEDQFVAQFIEDIEKFAFFEELDAHAKKSGGAKALISKRNFGKLVSLLLEREGMNYGNLPKGLLLFHKSEVGETTPFEEHLVEGALYAKDSEGRVLLHFTVSPEHLDSFKALLRMVQAKYENNFNAKYSVSFSIQKPSTDTIAVDENNEPFRLGDGSILFRPGGHGALIENLNDLDADIVFIKNIDNVVPSAKVAPTVHFKKLLAGVLIETQKKSFELLGKLRSNPNTDLVQEVHEFIAKELCFEFPESFDSLGGNDQVKYLINRLNRPLRVCGVVKNEGEPGGGPFWVHDSEGGVSLQIVESSQVNSLDESQTGILQKASHFNPVDLICAIKDADGNKFDLKEFIDHQTCFISSKSNDGKKLKALELPGLWNGAMAKWNTVFVEVPIETFNPVKTVNDLARPEHQ